VAAFEVGRLEIEQAIKFACQAPTKCQIDVWIDRRPSASPLRLPTGDFGTSPLAARLKITPISSSHERGALVAQAFLNVAKVLQTV
jgi:hypothetical protein